MSYIKIKNLLDKLNNENIDTLKEELVREVNKIILNIDEDEDIPDKELESLIRFLITRENLRAEARKEDALIEGMLIEEFIKSFNVFLNEMSEKKYVSDAVGIVNTSIRSIGGIARGFRLRRKYISFDGDNNIQYLTELKEEFYKQLRSYSSKGIYEEQFVIFGLINVIKFQLEEELQEHGRYVISMLTDYKTNEMKSFEEFEQENHLQELKVKMKEEFTIELQRRVYSWDRLMQKLQSHYYLEYLYEEKCKNM